MPRDALSFGRAAAAVVAITVGVKVLGFVEKQVLAFYFGVGDQVDAFFVASSVPLALFLLTREIIEPAFLPLFVRHLEAGRRRRAWRLFTAAVVAILGVIGLATAVGWFRAAELAGRLAPGLSESSRQLTASLIEWMILGAPFLALSSLTYITLNGQRRFALPAGGDLVLKATPLLFAWWLVPSLGITALALGVAVGCAGRLLVHGLGLLGEARWWSWPRRESLPDLRRMLILAAPLMLGMAFSQVSELADNYFASQLGDGAIAARTYAKKIIDLPILLLPYALGVVAFPTFASLVQQDEWGRLTQFLGRLLRGLAIVFTFLVVATACLAEPIVAFLLERGAFDIEARRLTAWPLKLYALGLVSFAIEALLVPLYFAFEDTRTPVVLGILGVIVNIALTAWWIGPLGVGGVALALTVSKSLKVLGLAALLVRRWPGWSLAPLLRSSVLLVATGGLTAGAIYTALSMWRTPASGASVVDRGVHLSSLSALGLAVFLTTLSLVRSPERSLMLEALKEIHQASARAMARFPRMFPS